MIKNIFDYIDTDINSKIALLKKIQNDDGGIPAYIDVDESGVWTSGEVLFTFLKHQILSPNLTFNTPNYIYSLVFKQNNLF